MGECYHVYLRDTNKINEQHNLALEEFSQVVMYLFGLNIDDQIQTLSDKDREESGGFLPICIPVLRTHLITRITCCSENIWLELGISQGVSLANIDSQYDNIGTKPHQGGAK